MLLSSGGVVALACTLIIICHGTASGYVVPPPVVPGTVVIQPVGATDHLIYASNTRNIGGVPGVVETRAQGATTYGIILNSYDVPSSQQFSWTFEELLPGKIYCGPHGCGCDGCNQSVAMPAVTGMFAFRPVYTPNKTGDGPYCLDVYKILNTTGTPLLAFPCHYGINQRFTISRSSCGSNVLQLKAENSGLCLSLDLAQGLIVQDTCSAKAAAQQFNFIGAQPGPCTSSPSPLSPAPVESAPHPPPPSPVKLAPHPPPPSPAKSAPRPPPPSPTKSAPHPPPSPRPHPPPSPLNNEPIPSVRAPAGYPFCRCDHRLPNTPFNLTIKAGPVTSSGSQVCITVGKSACNPMVSCCNMDFHKIKLLIRADCQAAASALATYDTKVVTTYFDQQQDDNTKNVAYTMLRLTAPDSWTPTASGTSKICFQLTSAAGSACAKLSNFCYGGTCQVSTFNDNQSCCPAQALLVPASSSVAARRMLQKL